MTLPPVPPLSLCKTLDPADYDRLAAEAAFVRAYGGADLAAQHPHRVWEYAMALRAWAVWMARDTSRRTPDQQPWRVLDVGGAGSPLAHLFSQIGCVDVEVCDPRVNTRIEDLVGRPYDAIVSISTIEHVPQPVPFLRALAQRLVPHGLCVLTTDYWNCEGPDQAHFHWMRERIYNRASWTTLYKDAHALGFSRLTPADWHYHGNHVYDYTFMSLALVKESPHAADAPGTHPLPDLSESSATGPVAGTPPPVGLPEVPPD